MKLLYLTREPCPSLRPDLAVLFGKVLPQSGIQSDLVGERDPKLPATWGGGRVFARSVYSRIGRVAVKFLSLIDAYRLCRQGGYDALQVRDRILGAAAGLLIARLFGLPFYYWLSLPFPEMWQDLGGGRVPSSSSHLQRLLWRIRGGLAFWLLYRVVLPRADHVFAQSEAMKSVLAGYGVPAQRISAVPMGVDMQPGQPQPEAMDDPFYRDKTLLVYLGALERLRHPEVLLDAMLLVRAQRPDTVLMLVGDSELASDRAWLAAQISGRGLSDCVRVTGWLSQADAHRYLRAAAIGLSQIPRSRVYEVSSPTKVAEYLAHGLPVVANDQPDQAWLLAQTGCGVSVPFGAQSFADAILGLLSTPDRLAQMAERAPQAVYALRSYDVLGRQLAAVYHALEKRGQLAELFEV
ncbi:glycosyltransferase family 4 protein [Crenobacter intestini]|uniref:Glycosyltransferase family 4 protein n=1 Tax=Crenobacter intestini TaxID=2563443 RepID=A0A4T0V2D9_9NEIS|nr:glycosyltransferase family 4 protein [Crenobacter intestini]TIC85326.1 glycosyltransferase family 4 protein [Crenobacter intestini]